MKNIVVKSLFVLAGLASPLAATQIYVDEALIYEKELDTLELPTMWTALSCVAAYEAVIETADEIQTAHTKEEFCNFLRGKRARRISFLQPSLKATPRSARVV